MPLTFYLATTAPYGVMQAQSLLDHGFSCLGVITTPPRAVGRRHSVLQPNSTQLFAEKLDLPIHFVDGKITRDLLNNLQPADFLLVVDFGFYIPSWLISYPRLAALNIHPSALPAWRGASPGQYVLLSGATHSAVCIMLLARAMDAGDLLARLEFDVDSTWDSQAYYDHAFALAAQHLPDVIHQFASGKLQPTPQVGTPTFAPKISKNDAFIEFSHLFAPAHAATIDRQIRAFSPRPLAWTLAPTPQGVKRLQLLSAHLDGGKLIIDTARLEGDREKPWLDVVKKLIS